MIYYFQELALELVRQFNRCPTIKNYRIHGREFSGSFSSDDHVTRNKSQNPLPSRRYLPIEFRFQITPFLSIYVKFVSLRNERNLSFFNPRGILSAC